MLQILQKSEELRREREGMGWDGMGCYGWLHATTDWTHVGIEISQKKTNRYNEMNKPKFVVARAPCVGGWAWLCANNETFI